MSLTFEKETIEEIQSMLTNANNIVLVSHTNADGDAVGSVLGMYHMLKKNVPGNKDITMILPNGSPFTFDFLPDSSLILNADNEPERCRAAFATCDLIIGVDFNVANRVGSLEQSLANAKARKLLVDHHINPDTQLFNTIVSMPHIAATCELLYWLGTALWGKDMLDKNIATCLYNGIMTDTGSFAFSNNQPNVYEAAARLVEQGINATEIHNNVMNSWSVNRMRFLGFCLDQRMHIFEEDKFAYMVVKHEDMQRYNIKNAELETLVNYVMMMQNVLMGALVKEYDPNNIRISFRSKGDVDVQQLAARHYGGGGHRNASGATSTKDLATTVCEMESLMRQEMKKYRQQD